MERTFGRSFDSLAPLYEFADEVMAAAQVADAMRFPVQLALEELFVNMVKYNPDVGTSIPVDVDIDAGTVTVTMTDRGGVEFDVTKPREVNVDAPLEERTPGGLGIHLIQTLVDRIDYRYEDGVGTVVFVKESGI